MEDKKRYIFTALLLIMIIVGNLWCYLENDRFLKVGTNLVMLGLLAFTFLKSKSAT